jgi:hypothetical protein
LFPVIMLAAEGDVFVEGQDSLAEVEEIVSKNIKKELPSGGITLKEEKGCERKRKRSNGGEASVEGAVISNGGEASFEGAVISVELLCPQCECTRSMKVPKVTIKTKGCRGDSEALSSYCVLCDQSPCITIVQKRLLLNSGQVDNRKKRFQCYAKFARALRYRPRQKLPTCVERAVKTAWPDPTASYVGYQERQ